MKIYHSILFVALIPLCFAACNKEEKNPGVPSTPTTSSGTSGTVSGELTGTWKVVKHAFDENYNLTIDPDEWDIPDPAYSGTLIINPDGTGSTINIFTGQPNDTNSFTWSRISTAEISSKAPSGYNYFGKFAHIEKLTATELVLIDTARLNTQWELQWHYFKR